MPSNRLASFLASLSLIAVACTEASVTTTGVAVSDSAGVTLLKHGEAAIQDVPLLSLEEVLRIGTLDGPPETQFFRIASAMELSGEIYVLDMGHHEVRVFDEAGAFVRKFGREGDGPGEFRQPTGLYRTGDTVLVRGRRLHFLDRDGRSLATAPSRVQQDTGAVIHTQPTASGWLGIWTTRRVNGAESGEPFHETITIHSVEPRTATLGEPVFSFDHMEVRLAGEAGWYIVPFFAAQPHHRIGANGLIYYTPGDEYRIDVIDGSTGKLIRRTTGDTDIPPVTKELLEQALQAERDRLEGYPPGSEMAMYAEVVDQRAALPSPSTLPVFGRMHVSDSGWLLALRQDLDEDPVNSGDASSWDLFDPDGYLHGRVQLSPDHQVISLVDDGLLAVVRDEMDVQSFVKYRFREGAEG